MFSNRSAKSEVSRNSSREPLGLKGNLGSPRVINFNCAPWRLGPASDGDYIRLGIHISPHHKLVAGFALVFARPLNRSALAPV